MKHYWVFGALFFAAAASSVPEELTVFQDGEASSAEAVNDNFSAVLQYSDALNEDVTALRDRIEALEQQPPALAVIGRLSIATLVDDIDLYSVGFGASNSGSGQQVGGGAGVASYSDFSFGVDASVGPLLSSSVVNGTIIEVSFEVVDGLTDTAQSILRGSLTGRVNSAFSDETTTFSVTSTGFVLQSLTDQYEVEVDVEANRATGCDTLPSQYVPIGTFSKNQTEYRSFTPPQIGNNVGGGGAGIASGSVAVIGHSGLSLLPCLVYAVFSGSSDYEVDVTYNNGANVELGVPLVKNLLLNIDSSNAELESSWDYRRLTNTTSPLSGTIREFCWDFGLRLEC